jgi:ligand-binding sensor domain-containing protein
MQTHDNSIPRDSIMTMTVRWGLLFAIVLILMQGCKKDDGVGPKIGPNWITYTSGNSPLLSNNIKTIFVDGENNVWFGTDNGASYFNKGNWGAVRDSLRYEQYGGTFGYTVSGITQSKDGSIWFGMSGGGVVRYLKNGAQFVFKKYGQPDVPSATVASVTGEMTNRGEAFVTTRGLGVGRYTPSQTQPGVGSWQTLNSSNSYFQSNNVPCSALNKIDNTIWFGSDGGTVLQFDGDLTWNVFTLPSPLNNYFVLSMAFDLDGLAWIGKSDSGISVLNYSTHEWVHHYTYFNTHGKIPQGYINAVVTDNHKVRWFGTTQGLVQLNDTTFTTYNISNTPELPGNYITALAYDFYGNLWIGTTRGVAVFNPNGTRFGN